MKPNLCLGTAQFGMHYGVTNNQNRLNSEQICSILKYATNKSVVFLDTAQSYGNAEELIGLSSLSANFKIISKITFPKKILSLLELKEILENNIKKTLVNLNVESLEGLLFHNPSDLKTQYGMDILSWILDLKRNGLFKRIGISIYSEEDLIDIPIDKFDIVQLPISIYDQRFLRNKIIPFLKAKNISVHIRSIFLQGIILSDNNAFPKFLSKEFKDHHSRFINTLKILNTNSLLAALNFVKNIDNVEAILFGISNFQDLQEILLAWENVDSFDKSNKIDFYKFSWNNIDELDPRKWNISI